MATKKSGLGKGLDSLISANVNTEQLNRGLVTARPAGEAVTKVPLSKVEPNREQPRRNFDEDAIAELADSIKQYGVIQPLIVQEKDGYYEIVAGERRWRAAKQAGLREVPVIIRDLPEQERMEITLIENIQRENLNPIEEALAYHRLLTEFDLKQEEVAQRVSKNRTTVTNSLRLLRLATEVQQMVIDGQLTGGHARCLVSVEDEEQQTRLARQIAQQGLNVRETEALIRSLQKGSDKPKKKEPAKGDETMDAVYADLEEQMKQILGTKVAIRRKNGQAGRIEIEYYSPEELDRILQLLRRMEE